MLPVSTEELAGYPDTLLKREMLRRGLSIRGLAKRLDDEKEDQERTQVKRWLKGQGITLRSSAKLAPIFGRPLDYFVVTQPRQSRDVRLEELAGRVTRALEGLDEVVRTVDEHEDRLASLEAALRRRPARSRHQGEGQP